MNEQDWETFAELLETLQVTRMSKDRIYEELDAIDGIEPLNYFLKLFGEDE